MKPIIFLDIDGVVRTRFAAGWPRNRVGHKQQLARQMRRGAPVRALDRYALQRLDILCDATASSIVITSELRRHCFDLPALLKRAGFASPVHSDWRTDELGPSRGDEIDRWLDAHDRPPFVIIDDKDLVRPEQRGRLILVDNYYGFQDADLTRARQLVHQH